MKIKIIETRKFSKSIDDLQKKRQLLEEDYAEFKDDLATTPDKGDVVPGTSGVRKIRMGSASKGKRGGFRVCYYYLTVDEEIYLLVIYAKNEKENLTMDEKRDLKEFVGLLKGARNG